MGRPPPTARLGITCLALAASLTAMTSCAGDDAAGGPDPPHSSPPALDELLTAAAFTYNELRLETSAHGVVSTAGSPPREFSFDSRVDLVVGRGDVAVQLDGEQTRLIADGDQFWVSSAAGSFTRVVPDGKEWVALSLEDVEQSAVVAPLQPSIFSAYVAGAAKTVRRDNRYLFDIDLDKAAAAAPEHRSRDVLELVGATNGTAAASGEATIEPTGHLGRVIVDVKVSDAGAAPTIAHWEIEFSGFGMPVDVEIPDDSNVVPLSAVPALRETFLRGD